MLHIYSFALEYDVNMLINMLNEYKYKQCYSLEQVTCYII